MSDLNKTLIGVWKVAFNQYRWTYTFAENGKVTWKDEGNGRTGAGTWKEAGPAVEVTWTRTAEQKKATTETWNLPINPGNQLGQVKSEYADGWFAATKEQARYDGFAAEGQNDAFACWAACLAWFSKVLPDVSTVSQQVIITGSDTSQWAASGAITVEGLMRVSLKGVPLQRSLISQGDLDARVRASSFPMLIGFGSGPLGGHVNVIHSFDAATQTVGVMEPWYPDPAANKDYEYDPNGMVFLHKKTRDTFRFTGAMIKRPLSYYASKPLNGKFIVGSRA